MNKLANSPVEQLIAAWVIGDVLAVQLRSNEQRKYRAPDTARQKQIHVCILQVYTSTPLSYWIWRLFSSSRVSTAVASTAVAASVIHSIVRSSYWLKIMSCLDMPCLFWHRFKGAWRAVLCVVVAAVLAIALSFGLAISSYRYPSTTDPSVFVCGTGAARDSNARGLPGVCIKPSGCDADWCCDDGQWVEPVEPYAFIDNGHTMDRWQVNASLTIDANVIIVICYFSEANLPFYIVKLKCTAQGWGRFDNSGVFDSKVDSNATFNLWVADTKVELKHGDVSAQFTVELLLAGVSERQADVTQYPGIRLPFIVWFRAWWDHNSTVDAEHVVTNRLEAPVVLQLTLDYSPNFVVSDPDCKNTTYNDGSMFYWIEGVVSLGAAARRGISSINVCMWILAGLACSLSILWCMLSKPQQYMHVDLMCFSGALLFAIPTMRGLLPAAPAAGTLYDVLNVYSQLWLVTISIVLQVCKMACAIMHAGMSHGNASTAGMATDVEAGASDDYPRQSVLSVWVQCILRSPQRRPVAAPGQTNGLSADAALTAGHAV